MRELLFRGKRKNNGEWVYGSYVNQYGAHEIYLPNGVDSECGFDRYHIIPKTVGQFTGLADCNGKKIFEGDIVNCVYDGELKTYMVVWDKDELDFKATNGKEQYRNNFQYLSCCDEIEIIGNIHDNPELMEK